jgi:hypothetical protein
MNKRPVGLLPRQVAGAQPPVAGDRRGGRLRIAIVAAHHVRSANPQFADRAGVDVASAMSTMRTSMPGIGGPTDVSARGASSRVCDTVGEVSVNP